MPAHLSLPTRAARRALALLAILFAALVALPALAGPLDGPRRAHAAAAEDLARAEAERAALDRTHEALAAEIEVLKAVAEHPLLPGVRDPRLDARLKEARAVAEDLAALDRAVAAARDAERAGRRALMAALDAELAARREALAAAPPAARRALFDDLHDLIDERQALARAFRAERGPPTPALPAPPADEVASPDELRELADETRDHTEQVQSQLAVLQSRLAALRERQRLVRAAHAFRRDDALFAQDERNRQVVRRADGIAVATADPDKSPAARGDGAGVGGETGGGAPPTDEPMAGGPPEAPERQPDPAAPPPADDADHDGAEGSGDDQPPGFEGQFDGDGVPEDPQAGGAPEPPPDPGVGVGAEIPEAVPAGAADPGGAFDGTISYQEAFDPTRLDEVDDLSPEALARRIEAIEARRKALLERKAGLEARSADLERRARALEGE